MCVTVREEEDGEMREEKADERLDCPPVFYTSDADPGTESLNMITEGNKLRHRPQTQMEI